MGRGWFRGRVRILHLPHRRAGARVAGSARIATPRGELAVVLNGPRFRYVAAIDFARGVTRGNHVHRHKAQWLYLLTGELIGRFRVPRHRTVHVVRIVPGDLVFIGPRIAHAFTATQRSLALEVSPEPFDPSDTIPVDLHEGHRA